MNGAGWQHWMPQQQNQWPPTPMVPLAMPRPVPMAMAAQGPFAMLQRGPMPGVAGGPFAMPPRAALGRSTSVYSPGDEARFRSTIAQLDGMALRNEHPALAGAAKDFLTILHGHNIKAKLGGSMAAWLCGARKDPQDIDIELESSRDVKNAKELFAAQGYSFHFRKSDLAQFSGTVRTGATVTIDLVNENSSMFTQGIQSPKRTGSPCAGQSSECRLIVCYINRRRAKPDLSRQKGDAMQVYDIFRALQGQGVDIGEIETGIRSRVDSRNRVDYLMEFRSMIREAQAQESGQSYRQQRDATCCIIA